MEGIYLNMKVKKRFIALAVVIASCLILLWGLKNYMDNTIGYKRFRIDDFNKYKMDFQVVVEEILSFDYTCNDTEVIKARLDYNNNDVQLVAVIDESIEKKISLKEDILLKIKSLFRNKYAAFDRIMFNDKRVTFCTEGNLYAIAYTVNGKKPQYMSSPTEKFEIEVERIDKNWFHIFIK